MCLLQTLPEERQRRGLACLPERLEFFPLPFPNSISQDLRFFPFTFQGPDLTNNGITLFSERKGVMNISHMPNEPLVALIAGILILVAPKILNYVIALYLIIIGILGLTHGRWLP